MLPRRGFTSVEIQRAFSDVICVGVLRKWRGRRRCFDDWNGLSRDSIQSGVLRKLGQRFRVVRPCDAFEMAGVLLPDAEHDERSNVSENGLTDFVIELTDELVCQRQSQAIASRERKDLVEVRGLEEFELVYVDKEWDAARFGYHVPAEGGLPNLGDKQRGKYFG
jgi:hypothetical protein